MRLEVARRGLRSALRDDKQARRGKRREPGFLSDGKGSRFYLDFLVRKAQCARYGQESLSRPAQHRMKSCARSSIPTCDRAYNHRYNISINRPYRTNISHSAVPSETPLLLLDLDTTCSKD